MATGAPQGNRRSRRRRRRGGRGRGRTAGNTGGGNAAGGNAAGGHAGGGHAGGGGHQGRSGGRRGGSRGGHHSGNGQSPTFDEAGLPYGLIHEAVNPPAPDPDQPAFEAPETTAMYAMGVLDMTSDGHGFLRDPKTAYEAEGEDPFVSSELVRLYGLRDGVTMEVEISSGNVSSANVSSARAGSPKAGHGKRGGQNPQVLRPISICGVAPHLYHHTPKWDELTAIDPDRRIDLTKGEDDVTLRIIDMLAPIGFGQRGLLVSPPRAGKTTVLQKLAKSIEVNYPEVYLIVLLIDERPEEATAMQRATHAEVAVSTNDQAPENHVRVTEMILKKAKRLVECGKDVVILMDSLTRLGRQFNLLQRGGGRTMSGGMDSRALERPKAFFGAARNIEEGGSLTIVATALIETGSRQDQVIFEEFKGTGNMELVLDRQLAEQRMWPAIDVNMSGTRKEEKLLDHEFLEKVYLLRRVLNRVRPQDAMDLLIRRLEETPDNKTFLDQIGGAAARDEGPFDHGL